MGDSFLGEYNRCIFILNGRRVQIFGNVIFDWRLVLCLHFLYCPSMLLFKLFSLWMQNFQSVGNTTSKWPFKSCSLCIFCKCSLEKGIIIVRIVTMSDSHPAQTCLTSRPTQTCLVYKHRGMAILPIRFPKPRLNSNTWTQNLWPLVFHWASAFYVILLTITK